MMDSQRSEPHSAQSSRDQPEPKKSIPGHQTAPPPELAEDTSRLPDRRLLTRVVLQGYKSIHSCDVSLQQLSILVGPNGAGKSNFIDALRFVSDALRDSLDVALLSRGSIDQVLHQADDRPDRFGIRLDCNLENASVRYAFVVKSGSSGAYEVQREDCLVTPYPSTLGQAAFYSIRSGRIADCNLPNPPPATPGRLYLARAAGIQTFAPAYTVLSGMGLYNLAPDAIRALQPPDSGRFLRSDGSNAGRVLARLEERSPDLKKLIEEYLASLAPDIAGVAFKAVGPKETLEFVQQLGDASRPRSFFAASMSDGTLRAIGLLIALFQNFASEGRGPYLVGIEEPESALHPSAIEGLWDILRHAAQRTQLVVASHSTDLLDRPDISDNSILAISLEHGKTHIDELGEGNRSALRERLCTAGELLRMDQLQPQRNVIEQKPPQPDLFDFAP